MFCRKCGAALRADDIFCSKCGVCVAADEANINVSHEDTVIDFTNINNTSSKKNKKLIIGASIGGAALLVAVIVAAAVYLFSDTADKYFAAGNYEEAADAYEDILEKDMENTDIRLKLAESLINIAEYDDAIEVLDYIFRYDDGNSDIYELLLTACAGEREDALANDYYEEAQHGNITVNLKNTGYGRVPDLVDMLTEDAEKDKSIILVEKERVDNDAKEDTILKQTPDAGSIGRISKGKIKVYVTVSGGNGEIVIKDYHGLTLEDVKSDLGNGFLIQTEEESSKTVAEGRVVRTSPSSGEKAMPNSVITVYISSGEKVVSVPKITGKTLDEANNILSNVGLGIGTVAYEPSGKREGTIIQQTPTAKSKVGAGAYIDVVISGGDEG